MVEARVKSHVWIGRTLYNGHGNGLVLFARSATAAVAEDKLVAYELFGNGGESKEARAEE